MIHIYVLYKWRKNSDKNSDEIWDGNGKAYMSTMFTCMALHDLAKYLLYK